MKEANEIWRDVVGYEGLYQVSNLGRVKSLIKETILKGGYNTKGYHMVGLNKCGTRKMIAVHRLVALAFIPNPDNKPYVDHINTVRTDNISENLRWCTQKENCNNSLSRTHYSEAKKGKAIGTAVKIKISQALSGRVLSEETKNKLRRPVAQYTKSGAYIAEWPSGIEVEKVLGISNGHVSHCCNGKRKTAGGFVWRFVNN